jgi:hypothetical protein
MTPERKRDLDRAWYDTGYEELGIEFGNKPARPHIDAGVGCFHGILYCLYLYAWLAAAGGLVWFIWRAL